MPKKGKKKSDEPSEPQHKQAWEQVGTAHVARRHVAAARRAAVSLLRQGAADRTAHLGALMHASFPSYQAVDNEKWLLPPDELPNSMEWPTWGALRERILTSCTGEHLRVETACVCSEPAPAWRGTSGLPPIYPRNHRERLLRTGRGAEGGARGLAGTHG